MSILKLPSVNTFSAFYGGGLLAGLLGSVSLGPAIGRQLCTVIVLAVGMCAVAQIFNKRLVRRWNGMLVAALILLVGFSLIGAVMDMSRINLLYFFDFVCNFFLFAIVLLLVKTRPLVLRNLVFTFIGVVLFFSVLQVSYMFFGVGMNPAMVSNLDKTYDTLDYGHVGVRSIFVNTNDLAVAGCLSLLFVMYGCNLKAWQVALTTVAIGIVVAFSGSRGGFVVLLAITASYYLTSLRRVLLAIAVTVIAAVLLWCLFSGGEFVLSNSYFFSKLSTISTVVTQYFSDGLQGVANGSASMRLDTYHQFATKFWRIGIGSFSAKDYGYLIKGSWLMAQDPHSLPIELGLLYGYFGVAAFVLIMAWMFSTLAHSYGALRSFIFCVLFFVLCFESSSSIGHRAFWVLLFAFVCGARMGSSEAYFWQAKLVKSIRGVNFSSE